MNVNTSNGSYLCIIFSLRKTPSANFDNPMLTVVPLFPKASKFLDWTPWAQRGSGMCTLSLSHLMPLQMVCFSAMSQSLLWRQGPKEPTCWLIQSPPTQECISSGFWEPFFPAPLLTVIVFTGSQRTPHTKRVVCQDRCSSRDTLWNTGE